MDAVWFVPVIVFEKIINCFKRNKILEPEEVLVSSGFLNELPYAVYENLFFHLFLLSSVCSSFEK